MLKVVIEKIVKALAENKVERNAKTKAVDVTTNYYLIKKGLRKNIPCETLF